MFYIYTDVNVYECMAGPSDGFDITRFDTGNLRIACRPMEAAGL